METENLHVLQVTKNGNNSKGTKQSSTDFYTIEELQIVE